MTRQEQIRKKVSYYVEQICPHGDSVLKLAYMLTLGRESAFDLVSETFEKAIDNINLLSHHESIAPYLAFYCWETYNERSDWPERDEHLVTDSLATMTSEERGALGMIDVFGLQPSIVEKVLHEDTFTLHHNIGHARQKLIGLKLK